MFINYVIVCLIILCVNGQIQLFGAGGEGRTLTDSFGIVIPCGTVTAVEGTLDVASLQPEQCWVFEANVGLGFRTEGYDLIFQNPWALSAGQELIVYEGDIPECLRRNPLQNCEISPDFSPAMRAAQLYKAYGRPLPDPSTVTVTTPVFVVYFRDMSGSNAPSSFRIRFTAQETVIVESLRLTIGLIFAIGLPMSCVAASHLCTETETIKSTTIKKERKVPRFPGTMFCLGLLGGIGILIVSVLNGTSV